MSDLFNSEAFEQMPGQMSMADVAENPRTWDGEPMFSPESVKEARELPRDQWGDREWAALETFMGECWDARVRDGHGR